MRKSANGCVRGLTTLSPRATLSTYGAIGTAFGLLLMEKTLHCVFYAASYIVPRPLLDLMCHKCSPRRHRTKPQNALLDADTRALVCHHGFDYEQHYADSQDGFVLALHRLLLRAPVAAGAAAAGSSQPLQLAAGRRPVVLLLHGLLMSSEVWVCRPDSLAFQCARAGYDVWLADMRGNRYSGHHRFLSPDSDAYWAFCLDDIARLDVPVIVNYILTHTEQPDLTFVGFSQGAALGLAALSCNATLRPRVKQCVAIAPAISATGFHNQMLTSLVKASPEMVYFLFGRRRMLSSTDFWRRTLPAESFVRLIEWAMRFLFGWTMDQIAPESKALIYSHLYSGTSVRAVVQYMQIMQAGRFIMYQPFQQRRVDRQRIPDFALKQVTTPLVVLYSENDKLLDSSYMLANLPAGATLVQHNQYQHLDFLFATDTAARIYTPLLLHLLARS